MTERGGGYFFYFEIKIVAAVVYGEYTRFDLIESRYQGKDIEAVLDMKGRKRLSTGNSSKVYNLR